MSIIDLALPGPADRDAPPSAARERRLTALAPVPARTSEVPVLAWAGGDAELRAVVADHAGAVGAELVDERDLGPGRAGGGRDGGTRVPLRPRAVLGSLAALSRRRPDAGSGAEPPLVALSVREQITETEWRRGVQLGVRALLRLPSESGELLDLLGPIVRAPSGALTIGVVGGCGGAGASSLAARLAGACARAGHETVLVDADPLGGGLDLLVEAPPARGAYWEDLGALGEQDGRTLREQLPVIDGVSLLVARASLLPSPAQAVQAIGALAPLGGRIVVDLAAEQVGVLRSVIDRLLVVCPADEHAVRAASRRLAAWGDAAAGAELVVRRRGPLRPGEVAADLGLELRAAFRDSSPGLVPLLDVRRTGADRACRRLVERLDQDLETATGGGR